MSLLLPGEKSENHGVSYAELLDLLADMMWVWPGKRDMKIEGMCVMFTKESEGYFTKQNTFKRCGQSVAAKSTCAAGVVVGQKLYMGA